MKIRGILLHWNVDCFFVVCSHSKVTLNNLASIWKCTPRYFNLCRSQFKHLSLKWNVYSFHNSNLNALLVFQSVQNVRINIQLDYKSRFKPWEMWRMQWNVSIKKVCIFGLSIFSIVRWKTHGQKCEHMWS